MIFNEKLFVVQLDFSPEVKRGLKSAGKEILLQIFKLILNVFIMGIAKDNFAVRGC